MTRLWPDLKYCSCFCPEGPISDTAVLRTRSSISGIHMGRIDHPYLGSEVLTAGSEGAELPCGTDWRVPMLVIKCWLYRGVRLNLLQMSYQKFGNLVATAFSVHETGVREELSLLHPITLRQKQNTGWNVPRKDGSLVFGNTVSVYTLRVCSHFVI